MSNRCRLLVAGVLLWSLGCGPEADPPAPATPAPAPATSSEPSTTPSFPLRDVTAGSGIDFVHDNGADGRRHYPETMGPGLALFDADDDDDLDLYVVDGGPLPGGRERPKPPNALYLNRGDGTFERAEGEDRAGDRGYGMGVVVGDADGDGSPDLYVLNFGPNALYLNDGQGRFRLQPSGAEDPGWGVSGSFFDADGDGDLDLYVANYLEYSLDEPPCQAGNLEIYCSPEQFPPAADALYLNRGDATFERAVDAGVAVDGRGMGVATGDLDDDGDLDLYVTNDRSPNFLYYTEGGRLREAGIEAGVAYSGTGMAEGGMGAVIADLTGSLRPAIFFTNFQKEPNRLYLADEMGFFDDHGLQAGIGLTSQEMVGWGIAALDLAGNGYLDLAVANGHVFDNAEQFVVGSAFALPDQLFLNRGGRFDLEPFPGTPLSSRGMVSGDLDSDGDPDLVVAGCGAGLQVWENVLGQRANFVTLDLVGEKPNSSAFGAQVRAEVGERTLLREVTSGGSYASHSATTLHLGLDGAAQVDRVTVRWPDGTLQSAGPLPAGTDWRWVQGGDPVARAPTP